MSDEYNSLIEKVSKNIVTKSKLCTAIAEELRELNKKLAKKNITRWNSTLFMVKSVLKLTPADFATIRSKMPTKSKVQRELKKNFNLTDQEREMLEELTEMLQMFEFVTDEFQSNKVSISKVYPCIYFLRKSLSKHHEYKHTSKLRYDLLNSINTRFKDLEDNEVDLVSTFLDPSFGLDAFDEKMKVIVKSKIASILKPEALKDQAKWAKLSCCSICSALNQINLNNFVFNSVFLKSESVALCSKKCYTWKKFKSFENVLRTRTKFFKKC